MFIRKSQKVRQAHPKKLADIVLVKGNPAENIEVLGKHYINTKQHLLIIRIDKRKMVLGVSDSSINFLTELETSDEPEETKSKPRQFKDVLNKLDPN